MSSTSISIHMTATSDTPIGSRIATRYNNFDTWATAMIEVDGHDVTVFFHSIESIREYASKLAGLSHALFIVANEQEMVAQAKKQANLVG